MSVSYRRVTALGSCVVVMLLMMTWLFRGMRAVMDIGGSCASGGPYVSAQPCPDGAAVMLSVAVPVMLVAAFAGSWIAAPLGAPVLLLPMWWLLFGSLGWNFLEYGAFDGDLVWGWLICGVLFELMALPALLFQLPWGRSAPARVDPSPGGPRWWWMAYAGLGALGVGLGWWTFHAWA